MQFPLAVVADFLEDEGFTVAKCPRNLSATFNWVTALEVSAASADATVLVVASVYAAVPKNGPVVLVSAGDASTVRDDAFLLTYTQEQPSVVAERIQLYLIRIYEWIEDMHHMLASHCTCMDLLERSEPMLKNYASVTDSTFSYIAHTPGIEPIEEASRYLLEHGRYSKEVVDTVRRSGLAEMWASMVSTKVYESNPIDPFPSIEHVYHLNNQYAAHLVMVCPKSITKGQEFLFSLLVEPIQTVLNSSWAVSNPLKQRYSPFVLNLLHGDTSNRSTVYEQARVLGIPVQGLFKVCLIDETWRGGSSARFAVRVTSQIPECKVVTEGERLVVLLCVSAGRGKYLSKLEERVFELVRNLGTQVGVSRKYFDLLGSAAALDEAKIALEYGKLRFKDFITPQERYEDNPKTYIYRFKRYAPYYVGDSNPNKNPLMRTYNLAAQILGKIEQADAENGTYDAKILQAYLNSGCRINEVAALMNMHRNSVSYRLKHIERTYDLDLSDVDERVFLSTLYLLPR